MDRLPEFDPQQLRQQLPHLYDPAAALPSPAVSAYRRFYQLPDLPGRLGWLAVDQRRLAVQLWLPVAARGSILLLHGYYDHMGLYRHLIDWALQHGFAVLTCDLPGHGLSGGAPVSIDDFQEYQAVLQALFDSAAQLALPHPWHLFGQSTGAAILLDYLLHEPARNDGQTVLLSPLIRPREWRRLRLTWPLLRPFTRTLERQYTENSSDPAFRALLQRDPLQARILPLDWVGALARWVPHIEQASPSRQRPLLVQGDADQTVDWQHNLAVLDEKFDQPPCLLLPGARHHLVNEDAEQRRRLFSWLGSQLH